MILRVAERKSEVNMWSVCHVVNRQSNEVILFFMSFSSSSLSLLMLSIATAVPSFGARVLDSAPPPVSDSVRTAAPAVR